MRQVCLPLRVGLYRDSVDQWNFDTTTCFTLEGYIKQSWRCEMNRKRPVKPAAANEEFDEQLEWVFKTYLSDLYEIIWEEPLWFRGLRVTRQQSGLLRIAVSTYDQEGLASILFASSLKLSTCLLTSNDLLSQGKMLKDKYSDLRLNLSDPDDVPFD